MPANTANANAFKIGCDVVNDRFTWEDGNPDSGVVHDNWMSGPNSFHLVEQATDEASGGDFYVTVMNENMGLEIVHTDDGVTVNHWQVEPLELF